MNERFSTHDHEQKALRLLAQAEASPRPHDGGHCEADRLIAAAQVEATLALAHTTWNAGGAR